MTEQILLVLPGGGNPRTLLYADVYEVIRIQAMKSGFDKVILDVSWPGHTAEVDYDLAPVIDLRTSVETLLKRLADLVGARITILARSYGCLVALKAVSDYPNLAALIDRLILWGPPPFWVFWETFKRDLDSTVTVARQKGLKVDASFFGTTEPAESLLKQTKVPTRVAGGTEDRYCTPSFMEYLRAISKSNPHVEVRNPVPLAPHEITSATGAEMIEVVRKSMFDVPIEGIVL